MKRREFWILDFEWVDEEASRKGAKAQRRFASIHLPLPLHCGIDEGVKYGVEEVWFDDILLVLTAPTHDRA